MNNTADVTMTPWVTEDYGHNGFGYSVWSAGDVNGDGYSDVIVCTYEYGNRAYLYDYFMKNEITHDLSMTGDSTLNNFGSSVSSAGDVNGDGYSDIIVGAPGYSTATGRAYIYFEEQQ
ncbi:MAG: FG-GAP repeat protein [Ignavibacteria bacterium]|nr:FG-GAP repeat protein [Ignavibacteria bacterium]